MHMQVYLGRIKFLLLVLALVLFCYADCRLLFYLFNREAFPGMSFTELVYAFLVGLRFDISAALYMNVLLIFIIALPFNLFRYKLTRGIAKTYFLIANGISMLANCADFAYFGFIHKRTTIDVFSLMTKQTDMGELLPLFLRDFWYVFVITIAFIVVLNFGYNKLFKRFVVYNETEAFVWKPMLYRSLLFVLMGGLTVLGMRGGLQLRPLGMVNAGDNVKAEEIPLVINTPFSIMASIELSGLEEKNYFSEAESKRLFDPCKKTADTVAFKPLNVVIIILESFSKEYTGLSGKTSCTPFLDSLMNESHNFVNAYANGKRSIEGIPAVLSGIPSMQEAYLHTLYNNNRISSIAKVLKSEGYNSSFYHGGTNGTMSFDSYCKLAGFDRYYGRKEYANEADYDGSWGIWDEPFFERYGQELDKMKPPFVSAVFSLSSHHPFIVPDKYKTVFIEDSLPIHKCVRYTDHALRKFFNTAKTKSWFKNTLFVITADHTGPSLDWSRSGNFQVPLLFYQQGSGLKATDSTLTQQIDIMNGILHYLSYDKPYFSFGNDPFAKEELHYSVSYDNNCPQIFWDQYMIMFNEAANKETVLKIKGRAITEMPDPSSVRGFKEAREKLRAFIQVYNSRLINNKMTCE
jgi:phosphoglycerol transferase MdoB-like AlkP superfamily enzyme